MDAFDADIVIYAAADDPRGARLHEAISRSEPEAAAGLGSVLLLPETLALAPPDSTERSGEHRRLVALLSRLLLLPVTEEVAAMSTGLRTTYRLKTADAVHLATAIAGGADRFVTNNRRDFPTGIAEIDVVYPD